MNVVVFKSDKDGKWYWRVLGGNNKTIAQSQGYKSKKGAVKGFVALHVAAQKPMKVSFV